MRASRPAKRGWHPSQPCCLARRQPVRQCATARTCSLRSATFAGRRGGGRRKKGRRTPSRRVGSVACLSRTVWSPRRPMPAGGANLVHPSRYVCLRATSARRVRSGLKSLLASRAGGHHRSSWIFLPIGCVPDCAKVFFCCVFSVVFSCYTGGTGRRPRWVSVKSLFAGLETCKKSKSEHLPKSGPLI